MTLTFESPATINTAAIAQPVKLVAMDNLTELEAIAEKIQVAETLLANDKALRNKIMVEAYVDGWPWDKIVIAAKLSRQAARMAVGAKNADGKLQLPKKLR